ncbi:hypothetical protein Fcan01_24316 [Folsomia candida]|uniref:Uncharacterized protein n=1 Tax=Folsomia candida TaxID=158441 RepID=A0A226D733_FOLCA|nr:hypothetical protein Fcan01_24316 [Folsomia candida]
MLPRSKIFIFISPCFFFFIGTEFYQGSLLSSLITTLPPELPRDGNELLELNLQIITTGTISGSRGLMSSTIDMVDEALNNPNLDKLHRFLYELKVRTIYIMTLQSYLVWVQPANSPTFDSSRGRRKLQDTFAVLDETPSDENFKSGLSVKRKLWVKSLDDLGLIYVTPLMMERTWLFPIFSQGIG